MSGVFAFIGRNQRPCCLRQEGQVGRDKIEAAQILKDHNVLVRGGPEQGTKLMKALVVSNSSFQFWNYEHSTITALLSCYGLI